MPRAFCSLVVDLSVLADDPYPAIALVVGGILSVFIAAYGKRDNSHLDELATYSGFILGKVVLVMAVLVAIEETVNVFTLVIMIVLAVTLFLRPMKEFPLAGLAGLIAGALAAFGVYLLLRDMNLGEYEWVIYVVVFLIVGAIVHVLFSFIEDLMKIARTILDWKPVTLVVGAVATVEGVLLLVDSSLFSWF
jgi:uncharacterized membrane protein YgdD (TMEM256/DUF423 family)